MRIFQLIGLLLLPGLCWGATLTGRVVDGQKPVAGMRVAAYADVNPQAVELTSGVTDADGVYRFDLPAGSYALFGWDESRRRFAFNGRNPVTLETEDLWIGLQVVPVSTPQRKPYDDEYSAGLEGQVLLEGKPAPGAVVYLYLDTADGLKGQGYRMSPETGADGRFYFDGLPESDYFLLARQRRNGQRVGPVKSGDRIGYFPGNPLTVRSGETVLVELPLVEKLETVAGSETFGKQSATRIQGVVVDVEGKPAVGVHVFAYTDRVIGHQRPAALSSPTAADGRFLVYLPGGGTYYLGARELYGDSPMPGELFGMYDETADHGVLVADDADLQGLKIIVEPVSLE